MFGTVGRMKVKPGKMRELVAHLRDPEGTKARGFRASHLLVAEKGDEAIVAVIYEDKDSYFEMVHDPRTDEDYRKLVALLDGEPAWTDGEWHSATPA